MVDIELVVIIHSSTFQKYYPVNKLRNIAMANANCRYIFMVDVDFVPSANLYENLLLLYQEQYKYPDKKVNLYYIVSLQ